MEIFINDIIKNRVKNKNEVFKLNISDSLLPYIDCFETRKSLKTVWKKLDFNNDQNTDLFVSIYLTDTVIKRGSYTSFAVIYSGKLLYDVHEISPFLGLSCYSTIPVLINGNNFLLFNYTKFNNHRTFFPGEFDSLRIPLSKDRDSILLIPKTRDSLYETYILDTLVFKFGYFINANFQETNTLDIESISLKLDCYGDWCSLTELNIDKSGKADYKKTEWDSDVVSNHYCTIKESNLNTIMNLIGYMNIHKLKDRYEEYATHLNVANLAIKFSDGSEKKIYDRGLHGTPSLKVLFKLLLDLQKNQNWN